MKAVKQTKIIGSKRKNCVHLDFHKMQRCKETSTEILKNISSNIDICITSLYKSSKSNGALLVEYQDTGSKAKSAHNFCSLFLSSIHIKCTLPIDNYFFIF